GTLTSSTNTQTKKDTAGRIFFLDLGGGRVLSANPDGSDLRTIVVEGRKLPDGLALDVAAGHIYWTNMGNFKANDGAILRSDLDGRNMTTIVRMQTSGRCCSEQSSDGGHVRRVVIRRRFSGATYDAWLCGFPWSARARIQRHREECRSTADP